MRTNGLVVTADDLGLSPGVTRGILEAHSDGVVRSASLLVTFPAGAEAAALARERPTLEVGLHLDLVGGRPASDPARVRSLVGSDGAFHRLPELVLRALTGRVRAAHLAEEIRAQADRARGWGIPALAWDSHRHTHLIPPVARVVAAVARERGVRWLRRATPPRSTARPKTQLLAAATLVSRAVQGGRRIGGNDWFVDLTSLSRRPDPAAVALYAAYGGLGEIAAHPGYPDDALRQTGDSLVLRREDDLRLLTDPLLRSALGDTIRWRVE